MQDIFGGPIQINDGLAKAGTTRERNTPNSQHFNGTALDLSTAGMSNADKGRLFQAAKSAGFKGFGFGSTILGKKAAMLCTASVEEVIDEHYKSQIDQIEVDEKDLREKMIK